MRRATETTSTTNPATSPPPQEQEQQQQHVHWDCSKGACGSSLLEACFQVWKNTIAVKKAQEEDPLQVVTLEDLKLLVRHLLLSSDETTKSNETEENSLSALLLQQHQTVTTRTDTTSSDTPQNHDMTLSNARSTLLATSRLPTRIQHQALTVVECREQARLSIPEALLDQQRRDEETNFLVHVVGILYLWDEILLQHSLPSSILMSLSPLPCQDANVETLQLLVGMPTQPLQTGHVTPTAAAVLKTLSQDHRLQMKNHDPPPMILQAVGFGIIQHGDGTPPNKDGTPPNSDGDGDASSRAVQVVRLLVGHPTNQPTKQEKEDTTTSSSTTPPPSKNKWKQDCLIHMEANLDDITAEALAFAVEMLLQKGAVDAWVAPIVMKKGRAAHTLHCLCRQQQQQQQDTTTTTPALWERLLHLIFQHTTTLGVRIRRDLERIALQRALVTVQLSDYRETTTRKGMVNVKIGYYGDGQHQQQQNDNNNGIGVDRSNVVSVKAEFDHCREMALETGIPVAQIAAAAIQETHATILRASPKDEED